MWAKVPIQWNSEVPRGPSRNLCMLPEQPAGSRASVVIRWYRPTKIHPDAFTWSIAVLGQPLLSAGRQALHLLPKFKALSTT